MKIISRLTLLSLVAVTLVLNGCGGGGSSSSDGGTSGGAATISTSISSPKVLHFPSDFPHGGVVKASYPISYYKVTGLSPNQPYNVSLNSTDSVLDFMGFESSDFSGMWGCWDSSVDKCTANESGELYVQVVYISSTAPSSDIPFSLNIQSTFNEGTPSSPVNLTSQLPYTSTLDALKSRSFFVVGDLTPGNSYTLALSSDSASAVDIYVYQEAYTKEVCGNVNSCTMTAAGSQLWVIVDGEGDYTLTLTDNGAAAVTYTSQGTSIDPQILSYMTDGLIASGEVDYTNSYYVITGLKPNTVYRTTLTNLQDDNVDLYMYSSSDYLTPTCSSEKTGQGSNERCLAESDHTGSLWVRVYGGNATQYLGGTYDIGVYEYFPNEGSYTDRVSTGFSYNGSVDSGSYYVVSSLQPATSYILEITSYANEFEADASGAGYYSCTFGESSPGVLQCIVTSDSNGEIDLNVYESTYDAGSAFTLDVSMSAYQDVGTETSPEVLTLNVDSVSASSSIGGYISYYRIDGLTDNLAYTVSVDGMDASGHDFYLYDNNTALWSKSSSDYACKGLDSTESCTLRGVGSSMWLMVVNTGSLTGAALTINVIESPVQAEGTSATPTILQYADMPYSGSTDTTASYYEVQGVNPGMTYLITLPGLDSTAPVEAYVYSSVTNFGSTTYGEYDCYSYHTSTTSDYCLVTAASTSLWIMVDADAGSNGAMYDLAVELPPEAVAETIDATTAGVFPYSSTVDTTNSEFTITNLEPEQLYYVSIGNMSADVDLGVSQSGIPSYQCSGADGLVSEECLEQSSDTGVSYVNVFGDKTAYGATFDINVTPGLRNEGSSVDPIVVTHSGGTTTYHGEVGVLESYYRIEGLTPDRMYVVELTGITNSASLALSRSTDFVPISCSSRNAGTADELCAEKATSDGVIYASVDEAYNSGSEFNLVVTDGILPEGSIASPLQISYTGGLTSHSGQVDISTSYYEITGMDPNTTYTVSLTGLSDDVYAFVYDQYNACSISHIGVVDKSCSLTTDGGGGPGSHSLKVEVSGSNTTAGATYTLQVSP